MRARRPRLIAAFALGLAIAGLAAGCSFGPGLQGVFVVERDGGKPERLIPAEALPLVPTWSPDGRRIAYLEVDSYSSSIVIMARSGSVLARFGRTTFPGGEPVAWSPDGRRVAFIRFREGGKAPPYGEVSLLIARPDGSGARTLATVPHWRMIDRGPAWSPDGWRLAWSRERGPDGNLDLAVVDVESGTSRVIAGAPGEAVDPRWSPDGRTILFTRLPADSDWETLWLVAPDGSRSRQLAGPFVGPFAAWSPNGSLIALAGAGPDDDGARLYVVHRDGSGLRALTDEIAYRRPAWTPDGRLLAFATGEGIDVVGPDGRNRRTLVKLSGTDVDSLDWSPDGTELLFEAEPRHEGD